jgi:glycosyltransferase involved in cell wall biosynthesis
MKLLICSPFAPHDSISHAGGQIHNYYVKRIKKETQIDMHIVTFAYREELPYIDLDQYDISYSIIIYNNFNIFQKIIKKIIYILYNISHIFSYHDFFSLFNKYLLLKELKKLKNTGYEPDIIELNWTQIVLYLSAIKKIFPKAKYYAVEHDVAFQTYERNYLLTTNPHQRKKEEQRYLFFKNEELEILKNFDIIFVLNKKDYKLLTNNGIKESMIKVIIPYFKIVSFPISTRKKNEILFYGAMSRKENYLSAIWFIENVFPLLNNEFIFVILGSNPHRDLLKYNNQRIIITGYQADIQPYFERALCMVAPLERGAGIKIKVLEALSAGIPVLGTEVASEGINVTNGINFLDCKTPLDYCENIIKLYDDTNLRTSMSITSKKFIQDNYDFDASFNEYINIIYSLMESEKQERLYVPRSG